MAQGNIIKDINLNKIRRVLKDIGTATKPKLAELTGLSVVTINSLVYTLINSGEILPDAVLDSEGGRPAASFRYNSAFRMAIVIYMHEYRGKDTAFYLVVNLRGELVKRTTQVLSDVNINTFDSTIEKLLKQYPQIMAICFGIPGAEVNQKLLAIDYINLRGLSLSGHIGEKFHLPVHVENDINAAVMGYCCKHNIREDQCVVGLYFPDKYPPGAGIYLHGKVYKGRNGLAGEVSFLPFGIDWETFQYLPEDMYSVIIKTIQAISCVFNPDQIILYGQADRQGLPALLQNSSLSPIEQLMLPEIIISTDLNIDFEAGIKQIAVQMIDTEYISS